MNWMGNLQQFGRALMLPMIALPAAAILLRLGAFPWEAVGAESFSEVLTFAGDSIFLYLPYIFAVGVALGLTQNASSAGMAALISYFLFTQITQVYSDTVIHIGVVGGIIIGVLTAVAYHRFKNIQFPEYIQFFGGSRFVPLFMSFATILLSYLMKFVSGPMMSLLENTSQLFLNLGGFGAFLYGTIHRLLVPTGLHHILNNFVWFQAGSYELEDGEIIFGDLPRFFAGDPEAGAYMAGLYPIMMFALPAIAVAIVHEAREDLKPKVRAIFLTAALTSFLTGVTEPIEFAFLFVAPLLFVVHAILSGIAMWITYQLDIYHGFSFSAGAIDFILNEHLAKNELLIIPIGLLYAIMYYCLFRWAIRRFQIPTPGREDGSPLDDWAGDIPHRSPLILQALGGKENLIQIEACITRLRLTLANDRLMDDTALRQLGAVGIIRLGGGNVQVVFGTFSELIREEIMKSLRKDLQNVYFHAPLQGKMISIEEVPDQIFAKKLVGDGVAFIPEKGELVSPISGEITQIYPTMHAIGITSEEGLEVLLHIGIDTSQLEGKLFNSVVEVGDKVVPGQLLIRFNLSRIKKLSKSIATPMVIMNQEMVKSMNIAPFSQVRKGQASVMTVILKEIDEIDGGKINE